MQNVIFNSGKEIDALYDCAFVLTDSNLDRIYGGMLPDNKYVFKAGEGSKTLLTVEKLADAMLKAGVKRGDKVAAFGGGVTGDILGFTASVYMRGIDWIFVPTSLLAMADSCIGGKTGVNVGFVKNAVGSFSMPETVYIETKYLHSLPKSEYESGMGEIVKTSIIDTELYEFMQGKFDATEAIKRCVKIKSDIVEKDLKDHGARKALNMGHTVGHAIEMITGLSHGKSVLLGMRYELLMLRDLLGHNYFYELQGYLDKYIGNTVVSFEAETAAAIAASDKKNVNGISIMYPHAIGDIREAVLSESEFLRLLKGAM